jgi:hypothetical protein
METKIAVMEKRVTALLGHHGRNVLSAAAARIEELVIQAALGINRKTAADYKMYTVEHLINKRKSLPRALREKLTADVCASMKKTMANILSKPDVEAGVHAAEQLGYSAWRFDPCDNPTNWYKLPEYITMVFKDTEQVKVVRAMVNEYVLLRSAMSSECEDPAPPLLLALAPLQVFLVSNGSELQMATMWTKMRRPVRAVGGRRRLPAPWDR